MSNYEHEGTNTQNSIEEAVEELADYAHSEDLSTLGSALNDRHTVGGARAYKIAGKTVFVSQVESHRFRGEQFVDYSPTEFFLHCGYCAPEGANKHKIYTWAEAR